MVNLFKDISSGDNPPEKINVVIDIPKGGKNKFEYNEGGGYFELDRTLHSPMFFPFEYGFIPQTTSGDGDSLDVALLTTYPTFSGCLIKARPVGVLLMEDEKGLDNKIIAVPVDDVDPRFKDIKDIEDIEEHLKEEIKLFFTDYKKLEKGKHEHVKVKGWEGSKTAKKIIEEGVASYKK